MPNVYSTDADVIRKVGLNAFNAWADNDGDGLADPGVSTDWHDQAGQEIDAYCVTRGYDVNGLQSSSLINRWATILACYYGSMQRGNPPPEAIDAQATEIFRKLELIGQGKYQLPGIPLASDMRPSMSNVKIDRRFVQQKVRVQQNISTDAPTDLSQNQSIDVPTTYP